MGLTITTIHIPFISELSKEVSRVLFEQVPQESVKAFSEIDTCVVIQQDVAAPCVSLLPLSSSVYDKDLLLDMACQISKKADGITLVCSVEDSDFYEFVVYASGVQFDCLATTEEQDGSGNVTNRASRWIQTLGLSASVEEVRRVLEKAIASDVVFAEDILLELGELFQVPEQALLGTSESEVDGGTTILRYVGSADRSDTGSGLPPLLSYSLGAKQYAPHLRTYPAAFPMPVGEACTYSWQVLSEAGGFAGCTVLVESDHWNGIALKHMSFRALPWYRGNVSSPNEYAAFNTELEVGDTSVHSIDIPDFRVPDVQADSGKKILLLVTLTLEAPLASTIEFRISIVPHHWETATVCLPAIRLEARESAWIPLVSGLHPELPVNTWSEGCSKEMFLEQSRAGKKREILLLNGESFHLQQAMFASVLQDALTIVQEYIAQTLTACVPELLFVRVETHKHMTAAGSVSKTVTSFPLEELVQTRLWKRVFKEKSNYQYISVDVCKKDVAHALAGFYVQQPLRVDPPGADVEEALHVTQWSIQHPEVAMLLGSDVSSWSQRFSEWISSQDVYQAWSTTVSEVEPFDLYEEYHESLYEQCCLRSFFYEMKNGTLMYKDWLRHHIRFVAPLMWLPEALLSTCRDEYIEDCTIVNDCGSLKMLTLKEGRSLNDLERALLPLLPLEMKRIEASLVEYNS